MGPKRGNNGFRGEPITVSVRWDPRSAHLRNRISALDLTRAPAGSLLGVPFPRFGGARRVRRRAKSLRCLPPSTHSDIVCTHEKDPCQPGAARTWHEAAVRCTAEFLPNE